MLLVVETVLISAKYKPGFKLVPSIINSLAFGDIDNTFFPNISYN